MLGVKWGSKDVTGEGYGLRLTWEAKVSTLKDVLHNGHQRKVAIVLQRSCEAKVSSLKDVLHNGHQRSATCVGHENIRGSVAYVGYNNELISYLVYCT